MKIGLVAGGGNLPILFARLAKAKGDRVVGLGLKGLTSKELEGLVDKMHWFEWGQFQKVLFALVTERITKIILLGTIKKTLVFRNEKELDEKAKGMLKELKDKNDYSIFDAVESALKKIGIELIDAEGYLGDLMPARGLLTKRAPNNREEKDIEAGSRIARELARFDAGQTVCVKDGCAVSLEGAEGTDEVIKSAGALSGGGFTVIKMARPDQDMRLDVPLVGIETLKAIVEAKGAALALEAKKTILIDREEIISLADKEGISIVII